MSKPSPAVAVYCKSFAALPVDENKPLGRGLGVTGLPTVLFFRGSEGLVRLG